MENKLKTTKERGKVMEREATTPKKNVYIVPDDGDRLMQPNEVCARLGTDNKFLKKLIILKLLKPVYFGKYARVAKTELNRFIEVHKGDDICRIVAIEEKKLKENKKERSTSAGACENQKKDDENYGKNSPVSALRY